MCVAWVSVVVLVCVCALFSFPLDFRLPPTLKSCVWLKWKNWKFTECCLGHRLRERASPSLTLPYLWSRTHTHTLSLSISLPGSLSFSLLACLRLHLPGGGTAVWYPIDFVMRDSVRSTSYNGIPFDFLLLVACCALRRIFITENKFWERRFTEKESEGERERAWLCVCVCWYLSIFFLAITLFSQFFMRRFYYYLHNFCLWFHLAQFRGQIIFCRILVLMRLATFMGFKLF